jgi:hypothetical protein
MPKRNNQRGSKKSDFFNRQQIFFNWYSKKPFREFIIWIVWLKYVLETQLQSILRFATRRSKNERKVIITIKRTFVAFI